MSVSEFPLPDVGEGLTEAEIVSWHVKPGDTVTVNQVLVEIETAKSLVELPSPFAGTVESLLVDEGQTVEVGTAIITVRGAQGEGDAPAAPADDASAASVADTASTIDREADEKPGAVLVGYGTKGAVASRRRRSGAPAPATASAPPAQDAPPRPRSVPASDAAPVIAKPPIRKLAKDLDVDLAEVPATGLAGEVTRDDVIRHAQQASVFRNIQTPEWPSDREDRACARRSPRAWSRARSAHRT